MLVFRCECEQVLSVAAQYVEKLGECPSCGRIVRVPQITTTTQRKIRTGMALNGKGGTSGGHASVAAVAELPRPVSKPPVRAPIPEPEPEMELESVAAEPIEEAPPPVSKPSRSNLRPAVKFEAPPAVKPPEPE
jgi:hypothetical protein